ncbi:MAG TPA: hypothetical protein VN478_05855, partial [Clostridia bacterium]|nr:hypothetical protein [Clostridia bacterium]
FENAAFLGAVSLRDYRSAGADASRSVASAMRDGEGVLLVVLRFGPETTGLSRLFRQAVLTLRGPLVSGKPNPSDA